MKRAPKWKGPRSSMTELAFRKQHHHRRLGAATFVTERGERRGKKHGQKEYIIQQNLTLSLGNERSKEGLVLKPALTKERVSHRKTLYIKEGVVKSDCGGQPASRVTLGFQPKENAARMLQSTPE